MKLYKFLSEEEMLNESFSRENLYDFYALSYVYQVESSKKNQRSLHQEDWEEFENFYEQLVFKMKAEYLQKIKAMFDFHEKTNIDWSKTEALVWNPKRKNIPMWGEILKYGKKLNSSVSINQIIKAIDDVNHLAHNHGAVYEWFQDDLVIKQRPPRENKTDMERKYTYQWVADLLYDKAMKRSFDFMIPNMSVEGKEWLYKYSLYSREFDLIKNPTNFMSKEEWDELNKEAQGYVAHRRQAGEMSMGSEKYMNRWLQDKRMEAKYFIDILNKETDDISGIKENLDKLKEFIFDPRDMDNDFLFVKLDNYKKRLGYDKMRWHDRDSCLAVRLSAYFRLKGFKTVANFIAEYYKANK
jgi:hypothetical protein